jgi:hypothetical protein
MFHKVKLCDEDSDFFALPSRLARGCFNKNKNCAASLPFGLELKFSNLK